MRGRSWLLAALALLLALPVDARVEKPLRYTKEQSYSSALRFLRVDNDYKIVEKDKDSGYLLFTYPKRSGGFTNGSIEVIQREGSVALIVQLPKLPRYHEHHLATGLLQKLKDDYGEPPQPKEAPAPKKKGKVKKKAEKKKSDDRPPLPPGQFYPGTQ